MLPRTQQRATTLARRGPNGRRAWHSRLGDLFRAVELCEGRNLDRREVARWVEVVLARVVDDAQHAVLLADGVREDAVDLAPLQGRRVGRVVEAEGEGRKDEAGSLIVLRVQGLLRLTS